MGRTECNRIVNFAGRRRLAGQLIDVRITRGARPFAARRAAAALSAALDRRGAVSARCESRPPQRQRRRRRPSPRRSPSGRRARRRPARPTSAAAAAAARPGRRGAASRHRPSSRRQSSLVSAAAQRADDRAPARRSWRDARSVERTQRSRLRRWLNAANFIIADERLRAGAQPHDRAAGSARPLRVRAAAAAPTPCRPSARASSAVERGRDRLDLQPHRALRRRADARRWSSPALDWLAGVGGVSRPDAALARLRARGPRRRRATRSASPAGSTRWCSASRRSSAR